MNTIDSVPSVADVKSACARVYDPEFGVSIEDLGLIYEATVADGAVVVTMTLTSFYCPAGQVIMEGVKAAVEAVPGVKSVEVKLVWEPAWTPELLSAAAREHLGWDERQTLP